MTKRIEVRAAFGYTNDEAIEHFREGLPDEDAEITSDGEVVRVTAYYYEIEPGVGILPEGAEAALRQVRDLAEIVGLGDEREGSYEIQEV
jgi:hypothetical protein